MIKKHPPIIVADAFTDRAFAGNPAGVCLLEEGSRTNERWMQLVAMEMNLSETAFVEPIQEGWSIRYFTPATQVPLCGHATLGAAHTLWEQGAVARSEPIVFITGRGERLTCQAQDDGWIAMDFPAYEPTPIAQPQGLAEALGVEPVACLQTFIGLLAVLDSGEEVENLKPNIAALAAYGDGVSVTAKSNAKPFNIVSRLFAPNLGIDEDPVTGALHTALGPYWAKQMGRTTLMCRQASKRGGVLRVAVNGSRVEIAGQAVTTWVGRLMV